jgi:hypothetical protein
MVFHPLCLTRHRDSEQRILLAVLAPLRLKVREVRVRRLKSTDDGSGTSGADEILEGLAGRHVDVSQIAQLAVPKADLQARVESIVKIIRQDDAGLTAVRLETAIQHLAELLLQFGILAQQNGRVIGSHALRIVVPPLVVLRSQHLLVVVVELRNQGSTAHSSYGNDIRDMTHDVVRFERGKSAAYRSRKDTTKVLVHGTQRVWPRGYASRGELSPRARINE